MDEELEPPAEAERPRSSNVRTITVVATTTTSRPANAAHSRGRRNQGRSGGG